jgi:hypothetical protein
MSMHKTRNVVLCIAVTIEIEIQIH